MENGEKGLVMGGEWERKCQKGEEGWRGRGGGGGRCGGREGVVGLCGVD
jgi:hypothetical protein